MFATFDKYLKDHDYILTEEEFGHILTKREFRKIKNAQCEIKLDRICNEYDYYTAISSDGKIWSFLVEKKVENAA